jgi:SAM-dependent methyltransferase
VRVVNPVGVKVRVGGPVNVGVRVGCGVRDGVAEAAGVRLGSTLAVGVRVSAGGVSGVVVAVGVPEAVGVGVRLGGNVAVAVAVAVGVRVAVAVAVKVAVRLGGRVPVRVAVAVGVRVEVRVAVNVAVRLGGSVAVALAVEVALAVTVAVAVGVLVRLGVFDGRNVGVLVGGLVAVGVAVRDGVRVKVGGRVDDGVRVGVAVRVRVGVRVRDGVRVDVGAITRPDADPSRARAGIAMTRAINDPVKTTLRIISPNGRAQAVAQKTDAVEPAACSKTFRLAHRCAMLNQSEQPPRGRMKRKRVERPGVRAGYDRWADTYDTTPNGLVSLDRRYTIAALHPRPGERVLDAGCGTGAHLGRLCAARSRPVGLDFSRGMLRVARRTAPSAPLAQADLNREFPIRRGAFDALLSALVSEHLTDLSRFFAEAFAALRRGGRLVFSAFHPQLARAGIEANFEHDGTEYRLGAETYSVDDYLNHIEGAGFRRLTWNEYAGDQRMVDEVPVAAKYFGRPLLLLIRARRPG